MSAVPCCPPLAWPTAPWPFPTTPVDQEQVTQSDPPDDLEDGYEVDAAGTYSH